MKDLNNATCEQPPQTKRYLDHTRNMICVTAQVTTFSGKKLETGTHTTYYHGGKNLTL